ncbi:hypothetical protein L2E82_39548 [Cichorium intybus]|uniref:Uncharacterized protein n=1 Tax=Cichorium intybus TaxID=13427 RepID=A0ACB9AIT3_CICIN|nr:hypothetical protein L2E82_39548 [Cichorium intybus]
MFRLKQTLGFEPSEDELAASLKISKTELQVKQIECKLAREKLAMSNISLVMSVAQKYANMGAEIRDVIQGGLIGLPRGIEKYDSSRGFKISTYVYWWIRHIAIGRLSVQQSNASRSYTVRFWWLSGNNGWRPTHSRCSPIVVDEQLAAICREYGMSDNDAVELPEPFDDTT